MEHYVTLFDSLFLPQGLALHASMERYLGRYKLWILCVDDIAHDLLTRLELANVELIPLERVETAELQRVKPGRSKGEYCWTLTPFAPRFVFEADPSVTRVTYLDADMSFRKDPAPLFAEFDDSGKHVFITDHAYAPEFDQSEASGQYCVQFMIFERDAGEPVRKWWEERCIEWCFARTEDGKFGDQKYLDDWPQRFSEQVHVLQNKELALAPWNATRFPYSNAVFWHFHELRISSWLGRTAVLLGPYPLPKPVYQYIYLPYQADLRRAVEQLQQLGFEVRPQKRFSVVERLLGLARSVYHQAWKLNKNRWSWL